MNTNITNIEKADRVNNLGKCIAIKVKNLKIDIKNAEKVYRIDKLGVNTSYIKETNKMKNIDINTRAKNL